MQGRIGLRIMRILRIWVKQIEELAAEFVLSA